MKKPLLVLMLLLGAFSVPYSAKAVTYYGQTVSSYSIFKTAVEAPSVFYTAGYASPVAVNSSNVEVTFSFYAAAPAGTGTTTLRVGLAKTAQASGFFSCGLDFTITEVMVLYYATTTCAITGVYAISIGDPLTVQFFQPFAPYTGYWVTGNQYGAPYAVITDAAGAQMSIPYYDPGEFRFGVSTSTLPVYCENNLASSTGILDGIGRSFSLGICNVSVFLFVPSVQSLAQWESLASTTREKIPFSYYFDFYDIIDGSNASTSGNFQNFSINLGATGVGSSSPMGVILQGNLDVLSTTTITTYLPNGLYDTLFLLMRSAIWIVVLMHIYRRIVPKHMTHV